MMQLWNDIDREKLKHSEINLSQCHFVQYTSNKTNHAIAACGKKPATNSLNYHAHSYS
jgi:hypothetical protein